MLCDVCKDSFEGIYDPLRTKRLELRENSLLFDDLPPLRKESSASEAEKEIQRYVFGHHETLDSFLRSKAAGCILCRGRKLEYGTSKLGFFSVFGVRFDHKDKIVVELYFGDVFSGRLRMSPYKESPFAPHGLNFDLGLSTAHEMTWELISRWFSSCTESHHGCNALDINASFMPSRVLKIDQTGETAFFQLVDGTECAAEATYMTLSYCWGSQPASQAYRLLQSTVHGMRTKQSVAILPKSIRDATKIAGYFQVQYLWVDRLCIFQDSAEDFQKEASSMADVYKNAILNIAALGAQDADGGCFFERNPRYIVPTIVHMRYDQYGRPIRYLFEKDSQLGWRSSFETQPLVRRAWTVQERLLARRVIYFGSKQIFWECKNAHWCETHPGSYNTRHHRWDHVWERRLREDPEDEYLSGEFDSCELLYNEWRGVIELFSKSALTVPSDKLVALSGLANEMRRRLQKLRPDIRHRYVAGFWEGQLPSALLWYVLEPASRAALYRAPTWSWASIDGPVRFPLCTGSLTSGISSLVAVEIEQPPGEKETGQVENASITLLGPVLRAKISPREGRDRVKPNTFKVATLCEASDIGSEVYHEVEAVAPSQLGIGYSGVKFDTLNDICQDILQIIMRRDEAILEGIALTSSDTVPFAYRRVGYFWHKFFSSDSDSDSDNDRQPDAAQAFVGSIQKRSIIIV